MARKEKGPSGPGAFEIRFVGKGMSPDNIRLGELADVLASVEQVLAGIIGLPPEEVVLGLTKVKDASAGYAIESHSKQVSAALRVWGDAIERSDFSAVPPSAYEPAKKILSFVRRHNCVSRLTEARKRKPLAEMTPDTAIRPTMLQPLVGQTTLYGYALRVGGASPRLMLRISDSETITLDVAGQELAREIGHRLYTRVGLGGTAEWHPQTRAMLSFRVDELLPYEERGAAEAIGDLSALIGEDLADIADVEAWVAEHRSAGEL